MKKKQKKKQRSWFYLLALALLTLAGYHGYQKSSFYKSAYNEDLPIEQTQQDKQEGKEYQSTGDQSLLDVKLPERLDNQTVRYKYITVYYNKHYRVPNCVAYELTNTMTSMADSKEAENRADYKVAPTGGSTRRAATRADTWLRQWICVGTRPQWSSAS
jgi:DNA/RNA endonuclease G (NUC1)